MGQHPSYRGPEYVTFGRSVAVDGWLTPHPGTGGAHGTHDPQDIKKVWHYLARFGDRS
jgi:hypothetical protein